MCSCAHLSLLGVRPRGISQNLSFVWAFITGFQLLHQPLYLDRRSPIISRTPFLIWYYLCITKESLNHKARHWIGHWVGHRVQYATLSNIFNKKLNFLFKVLEITWIVSNSTLFFLNVLLLGRSSNKMMPVYPFCVCYLISSYPRLFPLSSNIIFPSNTVLSSEFSHSMWSFQFSYLLFIALTTGCNTSSLLESLQLIFYTDKFKMIRAS